MHSSRGAVIINIKATGEAPPSPSGGDALNNWVTISGSVCQRDRLDSASGVNGRSLSRDQVDHKHVDDVAVAVSRRGCWYVVLISR